jgi:predicted ATPase/DNA-binding CsgD family transcriptional regulator
MTDYNTLQNDPFPEPLTERELNILALMAEGCTNREIGTALHLAETTVKWHNTQIFEKLAVNSRRKAVARCTELGLFKAQDGTPPEAKHNLPWQTTLFVGRHQEMSDLERLLSDPNIRLITILGAGGMGKTRLALELAHAHLAHFADGVYLVSLAPMSVGEQIVSAIAEVIKFRFYGGSDEKVQLLSFLADKRMLLVLDSFEHLVDGSGWISDLLQSAPGITVLATSREKLTLGCETVYAIGGMEYPAIDTPEDPRQCSAIELFIRSAERARPDFELSDDAVHHAARICRLVEGMPLGILLAAAWVDALSLEEIADEISEGLDLLQVDLHDMPAYQRSVRATFDRSWHRLSAAEQDAFMRLAVFRGGGSRAAVQAVTGASLSLLQALMNKSLLWRVPEGRYSTHELLRQYAHEKLEIAGEIAAARDAHSHYYLEFLTEREMDLKGRRQLAALDEIERDFENVRASWQRAVGQKSYNGIGQAAESLLWFSMMRCRYQDGKALLRHAVDDLAPGLGQDPHAVWGQVMARWAWMSTWSISGAPTVDLYEMRAHANQCLGIAEQSDNPVEQAFCLGLLGLLSFNAGDFTTALSLFKASLDLYRNANNAFHHARMQMMMAHTLKKMRQPYERALHYAHLSLDLRREIGDLFGCAESLELLGHILIVGPNRTREGSPEFSEAKRYFDGAAAIAREIGNVWTIITGNVGLACLALNVGDVEKARLLGEEGLALAREHAISMGIGWSLHVLSMVACMQRRCADCQSLSQESRPYLREDVEGLGFADFKLTCAACGFGDFATARNHLRSALNYWAKDTYDPGMLTGCLAHAASIFAHSDRLDRAAQLLGLWEAQVTMFWGKPPNKKESVPLVRALHEELIARLGTDRYAAALEYGKTLDFDATIKNLLSDFGE